MIKLRAARFIPALAVLCALLACAGGALFAQGVPTPPAPGRYVTDNAGVLSASALDSVNSTLDQFERDTSNQIVVALYPSLPANVGSIDQWAIATYNAWGIGQKESNNGALLLVAVNDHKMFICTGRGLEGALPDAISASIISQMIAPRFRAGDYDGGISAGVAAMIAATKGEYKGNGSTVQSRKDTATGNRDQIIGLILFFIVIFVLSRFGSSGRGGMMYTGGGWSGGGFGGFGGGGGGGGWSGGGGGGGGFSGGGGSSGGGGAGGSW